LATATVLVLQRSGDGSGEQAVINSTADTNAAPPTSALPSVSIQSKPKEPGAPSAGTPSAATGPTGAGTTGPAAPIAPTTAVPAAPVVDPMGGPRADIACGGGYIVQVASELDATTFSNRVAQIRAANTLPAGTKWAETSTSCPIFTTQSNVLVLYAGPFASPYDACPARLSSPPDAFIKGTTPETSLQIVSCMCPASVTDLPAINAVGQHDVWVGELQRVLGSKLKYDVGSINADPSVGNPGQWGTYTAETAAAVGRFQADSGLNQTNQVDALTWGALKAQAC
jgi:hypothetical protein